MYTQLPGYIAMDLPSQSQSLAYTPKSLARLANSFASTIPVKEAVLASTCSLAKRHDVVTTLEFNSNGMCSSTNFSTATY